jgi:hypothetical protein
MEDSHHFLQNYLVDFVVDDVIQTQHVPVKLDSYIMDM